MIVPSGRLWLSSRLQRTCHVLSSVAAPLLAACLTTAAVGGWIDARSALAADRVAARSLNGLLDGVWAYLSAACGTTLSDADIARALKTGASPVRGRIELDARRTRFEAFEQDGDLCGADVPDAVRPTLRCDGGVLRTGGRLRLLSITPRSAAAGVLVAGTLSAESWVDPMRHADHNRQGFGTSRIEHDFELSELAVVAGDRRVLKLVTVPGETFTDGCTDAGLGRFTLYLHVLPST